MSGPSPPFMRSLPAPPSMSSLPSPPSMLSSSKTPSMKSIPSAPNMRSSPKQQRQKHDAFVVFEALYSHPYGGVRKKDENYITSGQGLNPKRFIVSICHRGIAKFNANPLLVDWEI